MKFMAAVVATVIGAGSLAITIAVSDFAGRYAVAALLIGVSSAAIVWASMFSHGVRIAADAQHLLASLDVAVHTSPFMSDHERAQAMSL